MNMMLIPLSILATNPYAKFKTWGEETIQMIRRDYWIPDRQLYSETFKKGQAPTQPAFDWGVGVLIPALNAAADSDPAYRAPLVGYIKSTRAYWNPAGPVAGYDVLPMPKPKDRYYDDNEWMVLGLAEAAHSLHSSTDYGYAEQTFEFVQSGLDDKLGGGVYWREAPKDSKNTCSNGPAAAAALALYDQTKLPSYLTFARSVYDWTRSKLRDPSDGLYYDAVNLSGKISGMKWSYNSALMLRSAVDLYRFTGEEKYADDARELQRSSLKHWIGANGEFRDDGKFGFLLLQNWLYADRYVPRIEQALKASVKAMEFVHEKGKDADGHYGSRWYEPAPSAGFANPMLIDQAAAARAFYVVYLAGEGKEP
jgi:hypothetical protein